MPNNAVASVDPTSLPAGFVLDTTAAPGASAAPSAALMSLPPGFVLDTGAAPAAPSTTADMAEQFAGHAASSLASLPTVGARTIGAAAHGIDWALENFAPSLAKTLNISPDTDNTDIATLRAKYGQPGLSAPANAIKAATPAPSTTAGTYAGAVGDFVPAAIGGEGGLVRRAAQVAVPAVASKAAGDVAASAGASPDVQNAVKVITAIGTGVPLSAPTAGPVNGAVAAAERLGVKVPKYMASDGYVAPALAQGAKAIPFAGSPIHESADAVAEGLQNAANNAAPNTAPDVAGAAASSALQRFITKTAPAAVDKAYNAAEATFTNPGARVPLTNTMNTMQQIMNERANAGLPPWSGTMNLIANAVTSPQGMDYAGTKLLRTALRERTDDQLIAQGIDPTEAKRLYSPLTQDLESAVTAAGGQPALNAWRDANTLAQTTAQARDKLYEITDTDGNAAPEAVFSKLTQMAGSKASADINGLQLAKQAMGPQAWQQVGNAIISRLGRDPQGNFSPNRFIGANGYNGLSGAAKSILFTPQQRSTLDDLGTVSNQFSSKISKFVNTSKTAHVLKGAEGLAAMWAAITHPGTVAPAVGGLASTYGIARYLASPAVVQKAVRFGRSQLAGATMRGALGSATSAN